MSRLINWLRDGAGAVNKILATGLHDGEIFVSVS
jgi:hypothetical protein